MQRGYACHPDHLGGGTKSWPAKRKPARPPAATGQSGFSQAADDSIDAWLVALVGPDSALAAAFKSIGVRKAAQVLRLTPAELDRLLAMDGFVKATSALDRLLIDTRIRPLLR